MKNIIFVILFLIALPTTGQIKKSKKIIKPEEITECIHRFKFTPEQRLKKYPFNKAQQIQLVSFSQKDDDITNRVLANVPIENDTLNLSRVKGIKELTKPQIDKLTDILFNMGLKENSYKFSTSTAVGLDGGIIFFDKNSKIFEYINICFDCGEIEVKTSKVRKQIGLPCIEKMRMLKSFFTETGLTF